MDDELTPEQKFAAEDPETMVPRALMRGRHPEEIVADLLRLDWSRPAALALIERVSDDLRKYHGSPEARRALVASAKRQCAAGLLIALIGMLLTAFSILLALAGGIPIVVFAVGMILGGFALAAPGWSRWRLYRRDRLPFDGDIQAGRMRRMGRGTDCPARYMLQTPSIRRFP